ncbi:MAG: hypothetical protein A2Z72_05190 [Omnitrophica bacterium RBG_13_46_9]|nr:MAG: hypothetical protein A2Z72_05190 [Omnitrophica bacterium RBG_13_46_9]
MSIISEALKKAQESSRYASPGLKIKKPAAPPADRTKRKPLSFNIPLIIFILVLLAGPAFFFLRQNPARSTAVRQPVPEKELAPKSEFEESARKEKPLAESKRDIVPPSIASGMDFQYRESINLNGIMYTPEKPLAIINNSVMAQGDTVGEFTILRIERDSVRFGFKDEEFVIRLKR